MTDQFLADSQCSYRNFAFNKIKPEFYRQDPDAVDTYLRYDLQTENGVSPRLVPGQSRHLVCADSDEHDETGHITEDLGEAALRMYEKRLEKMKHLKADMEPPEQKDVESARFILVGWGTTRGAILESLERLQAHHLSVGMIHFTELWPLPDFSFPEEKKYLTVESNATGQLEWLLKAQYGLDVTGNIRNLDGLPITAEYIVERTTRYGQESV